MFRRLLDWLCGKIGSPEERYDYWTPGERMIFRYFNGSKTVAADPLVLYKRMMEVWPELSIDINVSISPLKEAPEAHNKAVQKIRKIFAVGTLEEGGLTDVECFQILEQFQTYSGWVKKNSRVSAIQPEEISGASDSSTEEGRNISSSSASGSINPESGTVPPIPSPGESVLPSGLSPQV